MCRFSPRSVLIIGIFVFWIATIVFPSSSSAQRGNDPATSVSGEPTDPERARMRFGAQSGDLFDRNGASTIPTRPPIVSDESSSQLAGTARTTPGASFEPGPDAAPSWFDAIVTFLRQITAHFPKGLGS
jgi:hypothetical protein